MDTDERLTADLARALDASFEAVVLAHQDRLYTIALRMLGDPRDAEEAAQDAFVRAYRALATYEPTRIRELRLRGWLSTIVLNGCRSVASRRAARGAPPRTLDGPDGTTLDPGTPATSGPAAIVERRHEREAWASRLAALPVAYRSAVVLRHVDGLSYPEAAAALGRPEGTVKAQVHRGIALLRTMLEAEAEAHVQPRLTTHAEPQELSA